MSGASERHALAGAIPCQVFLREFPFYFAWDEHDRIVEIGPSLARISPRATVGARVQDLFISRRPPGKLSTALARQCPDHLFLLEDLSNQRVLRGSLMFLEAPGRCVMLATPWITDPDQLLEYHLSLNDFGIHDQTLDLLQLLQTQRMATEDLRRLNRRLTEQRVQLRKLALVASRTDNAVIVTNAEGRIEWVNDGFTRITGWRFAEVDGRKPGEFLQGPDTDPETVRYMSECVRAARPFSTELINYRRDGSPFWVAIEAQPMLDDAGHLVNFMAVERDISERKRAQDALREYNNRLEQLVESRTAELKRNQSLLHAIVSTSPNGLLLVDRSGIITMVNAALEGMFGYASGELIGRSVETLLPEDRREGHVHLREGYLRRPEMRVMGKGLELMGQRKGGSRFPIDVALAALEVQGTEYIQATVMDMTEPRQAEQALRELNATLEEKVAARTAELATACAARSEFLANMSHEIRTPLNAILGIAQLLEQESPSPRQRELLALARQSGRSLLAIINDILDFSKIEAGRLRIDPQPFAIGALLAHIGNRMGVNTGAKGVRLRIDTPPEIPGVLIGDSLRIEQVLVNLIGNAIKFTERGEVRVGVATKALTPSRARLRFEIRDTGIGIDASRLPALFQPFVQAESGIGRRFGGTGLGLSISRRLVELMGGEIGVDSIPGSGSTFWFELPLDRSDLAPAGRTEPDTPAAPPRPRLSGLRVLVADDTRVNLLVVGQMLRNEGAEVIEAVDGLQVLNYLRVTGADQLDAILMDVQMPVMDGLAATRAIRGEFGLRDLPVIAFTAGVLPEQRREATAAGCDDFVAKPVERDELVAVLQLRTRRPGGDGEIPGTTPRGNRAAPPGGG